MDTLQQILNNVLASVPRVTLENLIAKKLLGQGAKASSKAITRSLSCVRPRNLKGCSLLLKICSASCRGSVFGNDAEEITRAVEAWQRQAPTLQHAVLRERMAAMAPAHQAALDAYLDSLVELAGIASAADSLVPKGAGLAHSHSGFLMGVVFPAPEHAAYAGQGAPRDITLIARQRAAEILAQLNV